MGKPVGGALKYVSGIDFIGFIYVAAERRSLHDAFAKICMVLVLWKVKPMWSRRIGMVFVQFWWGKGIASQYHLQRGQKAIPEWVWAKLQISQTSAHRSCIHWSYGVTVSTLDSESSDRGSNPHRTFFLYREKICLWQSVSDSYCRVLQTVETGNQCLKRYLYFSVMCQVFSKTL